MKSIHYLVNALYRRACSDRIGFAEMLTACEHLIAGHEVHLEQLADKLEEGRVRRVIEPMLIGTEEQVFSAHDLEYVRSLGFITRDTPPRIANPIYAEVIPRDLTAAAQEDLPLEMVWYRNDDGILDVDGLLIAFQNFRANSEHWVERFDYKEAGPQLPLQTHLQRVVNGGGASSGNTG